MYISLIVMQTLWQNRVDCLAEFFYFESNSRINGFFDITAELFPMLNNDNTMQNSVQVVLDVFAVLTL